MTTQTICPLTSEDADIMLKLFPQGRAYSYLMNTANDVAAFATMRGRMGAPRITKVGESGQARTYRIEGGKITPSWRNEMADRDGRNAWCEFTMYEQAGDQVCSFGGAVWLGAWPELFDMPGNLASRAPRVRDMSKLPA